MSEIVATDYLPSFVGNVVELNHGVKLRGKLGSVEPGPNRAWIVRFETIEYGEPSWVGKTYLVPVSGFTFVNFGMPSHENDSELVKFLAQEIIDKKPEGAYATARLIEQTLKDITGG